MHRRKIMIAVPSYTGALHFTCQTSIAVATAEAAARGWEVVLVIRSTDSVLARARNVLLTTFLDGDYSDIVFWDDDIGADSGAFVRLLDHHVDIVGGVYPARGDPEQYVVRPYKDHLMLDPVNGLMHVEAAPTGFLRISRNAVERLVAAHPDKWANDNTAKNPDGSLMKIRWLFDFEWRGEPYNQYFGEDYIFCMRWNEIGGKTWIDPFLGLHHTGSKTFSGIFMNFLERKRLEHEALTNGPPKSPPTLELAKALLAQIDMAEAA